MILKAISTGRSFGDKRDPVDAKVTVHGCRCIIREYDSWDGPIRPDDVGEYVRITTIETLERASPWGNRND